MKSLIKSSFIILSLLLCGCSGNNKQSTIDDNGKDDSTPIEYDETDDSRIDHIALSDSYLDLVVGKSKNLYVNFYPSDIPEELYAGTWSTSDSTIASVSQYGTVKALKEGAAIITYTTIEGKRHGNCTVYVFKDEASIVREYQKVTDDNSIKPGDQLIFGAPELGVAASINRKDGCLKPANASFSSDGNKLVSYAEETATFFVGEGEDGYLTLENQEGKYLAGKTNDYRNSLVFVNSKGAINWLFEIPEGYSNIYCVNADLDADLWLMFNKISDNDIRFNLYDSNPTALMIMPTIYRLTIVK